MVYLVISLTLFVVSFSMRKLPSEDKCNQIGKCYNPITKKCGQWAPCPKMDYCALASCPAYPDAQCQFNGCGGCNTYFIDAFNQIIEDCDVDICTLAPETGYCRGAFPRYYFNAETQQCETFIYGGCGGNANNFITLERCEDACNINICSLPADPGPCKALYPRYFYNDITGKCEQFTYGGCKGNDNNFKTLAGCRQTCDKTPDCVPKDGSFMGRPKACYLMDFVCDTDEEYWFKKNCGCGCKPKKTKDCVPDGWTLVGTPEECMVIRYMCNPDQEYWGTPECGCGCKPKESVVCATDVKLCPGGGSVSRDPDNNCEFPSCPKCNEVKCLAEPCEFSWCDNYPGATCENDYCDGCNAIWTDSRGNDVTKLCEKSTTTTEKPACVPDEWTFVGDPDLCARIFFMCGENQEYWSEAGCGCGCKPKEIIVEPKQCETGGCSGQVCAENAKDVMTTCEWKCEYGCRKGNKECGRGISGDDECGWYFPNDKSKEGYNQCMESCSGGDVLM